MSSLVLPPAKGTQSQPEPGHPQCLQAERAAGRVSSCPGEAGGGPEAGAPWHALLEGTGSLEGRCKCVSGAGPSSCCCWSGCVLEGLTCSCSLLSSQELLDYIDRVAVQERVMGRVRQLSQLLAHSSSHVLVRTCYPPARPFPLPFAGVQPQL